MNRAYNSWNVDPNQQLDPTDYHAQQKEIDVALSSAFDNVSNLSDVTLSDEECANGPNHLHKGNDVARDFNSNHVNTSTPMRTNNNAPLYGNKLSEYRHNISDLLEEESYFSDSDAKNDKISRTGHQQSIQDIDPDLNDYFNKEKISSSLLIENDKLSKQLFSLKRKCSTISANYEALQGKFHQLFKENKTNVDVIDQLQSKIQMLESKLFEERHTKENLSQKTNFLESQIDSLQDALNEHRKSDFVARTNDAQDKIISNLKQKHDKELELLRCKINNLSQQLNDKEEEILSKNATIQKYNEKMSDAHHMMELLKQERREHKDNEEANKMAKEKSKLDLLQLFDKRIDSLKEDWLQKLTDDVNQIIHWLSDDTRQLTSTDELTSAASLEPLKRLKHYLEQFLSQREHKIESQIAKFKETKLQLEEALIESRMGSSNLSHHSDKSQLMDELRGELDKFKQESQLLAHKLHKYKQHYHLLEKRHQQEIDLLKHQFSDYIRNKQKNI